MVDSIYTIEQIKICLWPVFKKYGVKSAILFGSYGKGNAISSSDVDLLVDSGLHGLEFVGLIESLRIAIGKDMDVVDISHVEKGSEIDNEIRKTGVMIYER